MLLRCPFCGTRLSLVENEALVRAGGRIESRGARLRVLRVPDRRRHSRADRRRPHARRDARARGGTSRRGAVHAPRTHWRPRRRLSRIARRAAHHRPIATRSPCSAWTPKAHGSPIGSRIPPTSWSKACYRPSASRQADVVGRALDLCGGSGHLTRVLTGLQSGIAVPSPGTVLADLFFWKLWLARCFISPTSALRLLRREPSATIRAGRLLGRSCSPTRFPTSGTNVSPPARSCVWPVPMASW